VDHRGPQNSTVPEPLTGTNYHLEFVKTPARDDLRRVFEFMRWPEKKYYGCYFSDDSCIAIKTGQGVLRYNLDISTCDASHRSIFEAYPQLYPERLQKDVGVLISQCKLPMRIARDNDDVGVKSIKLRSTVGPHLYSGSTITTSLNNLASLLILYSIVEHDAETPDEIVHAAREVGYHITVECCANLEQVQFLKHSPVYDIHQTLQPLLNIGVLLRLSGVCRGDLPGRGDIKTRAENFQKALLNGVYPRISFPLIDSMRKTVATANTDKRTQDQIDRQISSILAYKVVDEEVESLEFAMESIALRYQLKSSELEELMIFSTCRYGEHYWTPGVIKILTLDYGLKAPPTVPPFAVSIT
jgi:hypothetical protein